MTASKVVSLQFLPTNIHSHSSDNG